MIRIVTVLIALTLINSSSIGIAKSLAVTIYNDQFAMIKDVRQITFSQGTSNLYFTDVSSNIQTETVTFKALKNPTSVRVYQQNYDANLINTESILKKYLNRNIEIYAKLGNTSTRIKGILLGYSSGYILKTAYGIEVLNNIEGITFEALPEGFFTLPTLGWKVFSESALTTDCEVAYRTTGFSWKADYSITLNSNETKADIGGWVTIDNNSGKKYENAKLKLIAGDVNTVNNNNNYPRPVAMEARGVSMEMDSAPSFSEKSFSDYHMYTLSQLVNLNQSSQKQVQFIPKVYEIAVRKYNLLSFSFGGSNQLAQKASNKIQFNNSITNHLGIPLPKGTIRVFKTDEADGSLQFIGESSIDHTPKNENITVTTGSAFDIVSNKYTTNYQSYSQGGYSADSNITITNHKDYQAEIVVNINNYYGDNLKINWKTQKSKIEKVSSQLYQIKRIFAAGESFSYVWSEDYRP